MILMELIAEIRHRHLINKESVSSIARDLKSPAPPFASTLKPKQNSSTNVSSRHCPNWGSLKAVVEAILVGKECRFNRRFMALADHCLFEPVACTPVSAELNAWLAIRCRELAERKRPVEPGRMIAECFAQEASSLRVITAPSMATLNRCCASPVPVWCG